MRVGYGRALQIFEALDDAVKAPSLHPLYIVTDAKRDPSLEPIFFIYTEDDAVYYHGFHLEPVANTDFFDIQSPYGYGGPIVSGGDSFFLERAWNSFLFWCREQNVLVEFIRFHPVLENWHFYNGTVIDDRQTVCLKLQVTDILSTYSTRARTAVKKAVKGGLNVEWELDDKSAADFVELYSDLMRELGAGAYYSFNFNYVRDVLCWDKARLAICKHEGNIVAAAIFLIDGNVMEYHLSAASPLGRNLSATNLILHEAALMGQSLGAHTLHLGGGTDNESDNPLLFFKSSFSKNIASFKIGKHIHQVDAYNKLKSEWITKGGQELNRILFYRF